MSSARTLRRASLLAGTAALLGSFSAPAFAEQIETVIVTAERHAEDIQTVPESVATLPGDQLRALFESGQDIRALAARVPSLYTESSNGRVAPRFYIRGIGNSDFDLAASQPVSIIMDDVVQENVVLKSAPLYDLDEVEVLRGPQGTLFGRNTPAGIVKFTTKKPTAEWEAWGLVSAGELFTTNMQGAAGGPLSDTLSVRVSALYQHRGNYIDNAAPGHVQQDAMGGYNEFAGRIQFDWHPNENFDVLLNAHGRSLNGTAAIFRANILTKGSNQLNGNYIPGTVFFDGGANNPQVYDGAGGSLNMSYDLGRMKLTSITAFETAHGISRGDIDGGYGAVFAPPMGPGFIPFPSESQDDVDFVRQFTQELHLASDNPDSNLFWQVGALYFDSDLQVTSHTGFSPDGTVRHVNYAWAVFGQASYKITDMLTLTAGVRYTDDRKTMTVAPPYVFAPTHLKGTNVSWDVSAGYAVNEDVNLYARVATGFRAPSIQGRDVAFFGAPSTAAAETITSYEAGIKTMLFDRRLRLNMDAYHFDIKNPQFSAIGGAFNFVRLINAAKGEGYGFEADAELAVTDDFRLTGGASYNHTEIKDPTLRAVPCGAAPGQAVGTLNCTPLDPYTQAGLLGGTVAVDGNPFPQAPELVLNATARYDISLGGNGSLYFFTDWSYQGYTNFFLYQSREFFTDGNFEGGLKIGYIPPDSPWEVAIYARNITDERNLQGGIDFNNLTGFVSDPRVIGVEVSGHL